MEPKTKADREKLGEGLQRLAEEDPTFRCFTNEDTGQLIIAGMGELHLEIIRDRLFREFKVEASAGAPANRLSRNHHQIGRRRRKVHPSVRRARACGHAVVTIENRMGRSKGVEIENKIVGGAIPKVYPGHRRRH